MSCRRWRDTDGLLRARPRVTVCGFAPRRSRSHPAHVPGDDGRAGERPGRCPAYRGMMVVRGNGRVAVRRAGGWWSCVESAGALSGVLPGRRSCVESAGAPSGVPGCGGLAGNGQDAVRRAGSGGGAAIAYGVPGCGRLPGNVAVRGAVRLPGFPWLSACSPLWRRSISRGRNDPLSVHRAAPGRHPRVRCIAAWRHPVPPGVGERAFAGSHDVATVEPCSASPC